MEDLILGEIVYESGSVSARLVDVENQCWELFSGDHVFSIVPYQSRDEAIALAALASKVKDDTSKLYESFSVGDRVRPLPEKECIGTVMSVSNEGDEVGVHWDNKDTDLQYFNLTKDIFKHQ